MSAAGFTKSSPRRQDLTAVIGPILTAIKRRDLHISQITTAYIGQGFVSLVGPPLWLIFS